jgi:hypothetical protein
MEPRIGIEVTDKDGRPLGAIDYVVRDTWSGEIRKCIIYGKPPLGDLAFSPQDISEMTEDSIRLNITIDKPA